MLPLKDNVPTRTTPVVTIGLIAANAIVWLWQVQNGVDKEVVNWGYYPCAVEGPCVGVAKQHHELVEIVFSSMFMHGGWVHFLGNMLFLWIFGNNVEDAMGRVRYLVFYLLAGIAATALQTAITLHSASDAAARIPNLGASGAISGVLGAYFLLLPRARVLTAFFFILILLREIPAWIFLGIYFLFQAYEANFQLQHPPEEGGVAVFAHIGGIVFGLLTVYLFRKRQPLRPAY